ncbi:MAG: monofunctional biosynthetic peptidoglycan transglycosylase [Nitrospirota bacterium]|nr:monofunctional biosynthetic peptidoglycan transglycosylase [Nitrospirota bacterium]
MSRASRKGRPVRPNRRLWNLGQRSQGRSRRSKRFVWLRKFPFKLFLGIVCLFLLFEIFTLPIFSIANLDTDNPKVTALMQQRIEEAKDTGKTLRIDYRWVSLSRIPKHVRMAVLVAEDGAFYAHAGVDWHEVWESLETNWEEGRIVRGGSTITQQLAKNLYLSTSKDPIRKFKELLITWILEARLTKKRILELYLNIIEWGPGMFGIEAAAQRHFHKPASRLTMEEAARLAAVIPSPLHRRPTDDNDYVNNKVQLILKRMSTR